MGLIVPGGGRAPNTVYAECNNLMSNVNVAFDTFYDEDQAAITPGADVIAALAAIGLEYVSPGDYFNAIQLGEYHVGLAINPIIEATPGATKYADFIFPSYWGSTQIEWGDGYLALNKPGPQIPAEQDIYQSFTFFAKPGGAVSLQRFWLQVFSSLAVDVIDYAVLELQQIQKG